MINAEQKSCSKCDKSKPRSEFYRHQKNKDGLSGKCKECTKRDVRRRYRENFAAIQVYEKRRAMLPHRVKARMDYARSPAGKVAGARGKKRWQERNPEKRAAHIATGNAIRDGKLQKQPCEVCAEKTVHAHHDDYSKPLEVRWLCVRHHREEHIHS